MLISDMLAIYETYEKVGRAFSLRHFSTVYDKIMGKWQRP